MRGPPDTWDMSFQNKKGPSINFPLPYQPTPAVLDETTYLHTTLLSGLMQCPDIKCIFILSPRPTVHKVGARHSAYLSDSEIDRHMHNGECRGDRVLPQTKSSPTDRNGSVCIAHLLWLIHPLKVCRRGSRCIIGMRGSQSITRQMPKGTRNLPSSRSEASEQTPPAGLANQSVHPSFDPSRRTNGHCHFEDCTVVPDGNNKQSEKRYATHPFAQYDSRSHGQYVGAIPIFSSNANEYFVKHARVLALRTLITHTQHTPGSTGTASVSLLSPKAGGRFAKKHTIVELT